MSPTALKRFKQQIFQLQSNQSADFEQMALALFRYQSKHNKIYKKYLDLLCIDCHKIKHIYQIPFLPISLFKTHKIIMGTGNIQQTFSSSGTSQTGNSRHYVTDIALYQQSFSRAFRHFYGAVTDYCILALLPAYLERTGSSLVYMAEQLIQASGHSRSGFYLYNYDVLTTVLQELEQQQQQTILLGVSFALWEFSEYISLPLRSTILMETGGMKGRRKEVVRAELHGLLQQAFDVPVVHSEYGMTELLSQAYSRGKGRFYCPPWMRVVCREVNDPFALQTYGRTGGLNVIDLANVDSCAFVATNDLGKCYVDGSFEVLGRFDYSDIRGCNLLIG